MNRRLARVFVVWVAVCGALFSAPAVACMFSDEYPEVTDLRQFDQVFSGLVIWTDRFDPPRHPQIPGIAPTDLGWWYKSKVMVFRVWRGTPPPVTEVWTRAGSSCDLGIFPGLYFVALTKREGGRSVADHSYYSRAQAKYVSNLPANLAYENIVPIGAVVGLGTFAIIWFSNRGRRRKLSAGKN